MSEILPKIPTIGFESLTCYSPCHSARAIRVSEFKQTDFLPLPPSTTPGMTEAIQQAIQDAKKQEVKEKIQNVVTKTRNSIVMQNVLKALAYIPVIGISIGIQHICDGIRDKRFSATMIARGLLEFIGLGFLLLIPDLIMQCMRNQKATSCLNQRTIQAIKVDPIAVFHKKVAAFVKATLLKDAPQPAPQPAPPAIKEEPKKEPEPDPVPEVKEVEPTPAPKPEPVKVISYDEFAAELNEIVQGTKITKYNEFAEKLAQAGIGSDPQSAFDEILSKSHDGPVWIEATKGLMHSLASELNCIFSEDKVILCKNIYIDCVKQLLDKYFELGGSKADENEFVSFAKKLGDELGEKIMPELVTAENAESFVIPGLPEILHKDLKSMEISKASYESIKECIANTGVLAKILLQGTLSQAWPEGLDKALMLEVVTFLMTLPTKFPSYGIHYGKICNALKEVLIPEYKLYIQGCVLKTIGKEDEAVELWKEAAEKGVHGARVDLGQYYSLKENYADSVKYYGMAKVPILMDSALKTSMINDLPDLKLEEVYKKAADFGSSMGLYCYAGCQFESGKQQEALKNLKKAAKMGNVLGAHYAAHSIGVIYHRGEVVPKNNEKAFKWMEKATKASLPKSMYLLGHFYQTGDGVAQSLSQALEWKEKAANLGYEQAIMDLAKYYDSVNQVKEALHWYEKGADLKIPAAMGTYGEILLSGIPGFVEADEVEAERLLKKSVKHGDLNGMYVLSQKYYNANNFKDAFPLIKHCAEKDIPEAQYVVARMYKHGWGVDADMKAAKEWYKKAAEQGHAQGQYSYAELIEEEDLPKALDLYEKSAKQGYALAAWSAGVIYKDQESYNKAAAFFLDYVDHDKEGDADYGLGQLHGHQLIDDSSLDQAKKYYISGANKGNTACQVAAGRLHYEDDEFAKAGFWFNEALEKDLTGAAAYFLSKLHNDKQIDKPSPEQAKQLFAEALKKSYVKAILDQAQEHYDAKEYEEAYSAFERAMPKDSTGEAECMMGLLHQDKLIAAANDEDAKKYFRISYLNKKNDKAFDKAKLTSWFF